MEKSEKEENGLKSVAGQADDGMIVVEEDKIMLQIGKSNGKEFVYFNSKNLHKKDPELKAIHPAAAADGGDCSSSSRESQRKFSSSTYRLHNPTYAPFDGNSGEHASASSDFSLSHFDSRRRNGYSGCNSLHRSAGASETLENLRIVPSLSTNATAYFSSSFSSSSATAIAKERNFEFPELSRLMDDVKVLSRDLRPLKPQNVETIEMIGLADFGSIELCSMTSEEVDEFDRKTAKRETCARTRHPSSSAATAAAAAAAVATTTMAVVLNLSSGTKDKNKLKFLRQLKTLLQLKDPNILTVTGLCHRNDDDNDVFSVVMETVTWRNMHQFLLESTTEPGRPEPEMMQDGWYNIRSIGGTELRFLSLGCLTHLGCQVASGMKYLEKCGLVHGDLAARNCLVGPKRLVKICDLARWRSPYRADYYHPPRPRSPPLPLRWMAWEAIHLDELSIKSDVWSFGVLLWEIMTLSRQRPYPDLTDDQVMDNSLLQRGGTGPGTAYPLKPLRCPPETYDLMTSCWRADPSERPRFKEIFAFLSHKITGYEPHR